MRLQEIKDEVAREKGFETWLRMVFAFKDNTKSITTGDFLDIIDTVAMRLAKECCDTQKEIFIKEINPAPGTKLYRKMNEASYPEILTEN